MLDSSAWSARRLQLLCASIAVLLLLGTIAVATQSGSSDESLDGAAPTAPAEPGADGTPDASGAPSAADPSASRPGATTPGPRASDAARPGSPGRSQTRPGTAPGPAAGGPAGTSAPRAAPDRVTWRTGAFSGSSLSEHKAFGTWRNRPLGTALWFMARDSWPAMENPLYWATEHAKDRSVVPVLSYAMWPVSEKGASLARGAAGDYDEHWARLASNLVAQGLPNAVIRPGWEFNGDWYPWSTRTPADAAAFGAYFKRIVVAMRSVKGQDFAFSWNPVLGGGPVDPSLAWPGDAYVDDVGLDVYNAALKPGLRGAALWQSHVDIAHGLRWHRDFAKRHGKRVSYPEWGALASTGDDPNFLRSMFAWMRQNPPTYENYFDHDGGPSANYALFSPGSAMPISARTYRELWGR